MATLAEFLRAVTPLVRDWKQWERRREGERAALVEAEGYLEWSRVREGLATVAGSEEADQRGQAEIERIVQGAHDADAPREATRLETRMRNELRVAVQDRRAREQRQAAAEARDQVLRQYAGLRADQHRYSRLTASTEPGVAAAARTALADTVAAIGRLEGSLGTSDLAVESFRKRIRTLGEDGAYRTIGAMLEEQGRGAVVQLGSDLRNTHAPARMPDGTPFLDAWGAFGEPLPLKTALGYVDDHLRRADERAQEAEAAADRAEQAQRAREEGMASEALHEVRSGQIPRVDARRRLEAAGVSPDVVEEGLLRPLDQRPRYLEVTQDEAAVETDRLRATLHWGKANERPEVVGQVMAAVRTARAAGGITEDQAEMLTKLAGEAQSHIAEASSSVKRTERINAQTGERIRTRLDVGGHVDLGVLQAAFGDHGAAVHAQRRRAVEALEPKVAVWALRLWGPEYTQAQSDAVGDFLASEIRAATDPARLALLGAGHDAASVTSMLDDRVTSLVHRLESPELRKRVAEARSRRDVVAVLDPALGRTLTERGLLVGGAAAGPEAEVDPHRVLHYAQGLNAERRGAGTRFWRRYTARANLARALAGLPPLDPTASWDESELEVMR